MANKAVVWGVVLVVGVGGLIGWRFTTKAADAAKLQQGQGARGGKGTPSVSLTEAQPKEIINSLELVGTVESPYNLKLSPRISGRIDQLSVREGDSVKAGQVLFHIDPAELQGAVLQAQAAVAEARSRLAQAKLTQGSTNTGINAQIRQQAASVDSAKADYAQVKSSYAANVSTAETSVTDAEAKVAAAEAQVNSSQADLDSAQANFENSQSKLNRVQDLYRQGFTAAQDVDDAKTALRVQQSAVQVAKRKLDSSRSALTSAKAQLRAARNNLAVTKDKGQSDIEASKARLTQARANYDVATANKSQTPAYQENILALSASVAAAEAQLRQAQAKIIDTDVRSSIDGIVTTRSADPGAIASPGTPVLTVQFLKWVYVTASVPVEQTGKVSIGMPVSISIDSLSGKLLTGKISELNPSADLSSRQFTIRVKLDNENGALRPGMYAHVKLTLENVQAAVTVPHEAISQTKSGPTVFVVNDKMVAHQVAVETGVEDSQTVQIRSGIKAGEKVVTLAYTPIKDGQTVRTGSSKGNKGTHTGNSK